MGFVHYFLCLYLFLYSGKRQVENGISDISEICSTLCFHWLVPLPMNDEPPRICFSTYLCLFQQIEGNITGQTDTC